MITSQEASQSASNMDSVLSNLNRNLSSSTDYFKILVDVFSKSLKGSENKNPHLNNFYVVLPALSLSFVESITARKEKMTRKSLKTTKTSEANIGFTDDGFTVGVAYILTVLDQYSSFDSLHWFDSVQEKIDRDNEEAMKDRAQDDKLTQTTSLTLKRLQVMQREFDLLKYNLTSCKILFSS